MPACTSFIYSRTSAIARLLEGLFSLQMSMSAPSLQPSWLLTTLRTSLRAWPYLSRRSLTQWWLSGPNPPCIWAYLSTINTGSSFANVPHELAKHFPTLLFTGRSLTRSNWRPVSSTPFLLMSLRIPIWRRKSTRSKLQMIAGIDALKTLDHELNKGQLQIIDHVFKGIPHHTYESLSDGKGHSGFESSQSPSPSPLRLPSPSPVSSQPSSSLLVLSWSLVSWDGLQIKQG